MNKNIRKHIKNKRRVLQGFHEVASCCSTTSASCDPRKARVAHIIAGAATSDVSIV